MSWTSDKEFFSVRAQVASRIGRAYGSSALCQDYGVVQIQTPTSRSGARLSDTGECVPAFVFVSPSAKSSEKDVSEIACGNCAVV